MTALDFACRVIGLPTGSDRLALDAAIMRLDEPGREEIYDSSVTSLTEDDFEDDELAGLNLLIEAMRCAEDTPKSIGKSFTAG